MNIHIVVFERYDFAQLVLLYNSDGVVYDYNIPVDCVLYLFETFVNGY